MFLEQAFTWLGETGPGQFLAASTPAFAATESLHILSFSVLGGSLLALDLAALGVIFRKSGVLTVGRSLLPIFLAALLGAAVTGLLLVAAGPMKYYTNPLFPWKLGVLAIAASIHLLLYPGLVAVGGRVGEAYVRPLAAALGGSSLLLWLTMAVLGRWLGLI
jgi:hypothetical protein